MKIDSHIENLRKKHESIEQKLHDKLIHHADDDEILDLKRQKLLIKDQIHMLLKKLEDIK